MFIRADGHGIFHVIHHEESKTREDGCSTAQDNLLESSRFFRYGDSSLTYGSSPDGAA